MLLHADVAILVFHHLNLMPRETLCTYTVTKSCKIFIFSMNQLPEKGHDARGLLEAFRLKCLDKGGVPKPRIPSFSSWLWKRCHLAIKAMGRGGTAKHTLAWFFWTARSQVDERWEETVPGWDVTKACSVKGVSQYSGLKEMWICAVLVPCTRPKGIRMASQEANQQKAGWCSGKADGHTEHQKESSKKPIKDSVKVVFTAHTSVLQGTKLAQCLFGIAKGIMLNPNQILY